MPDSEHPASDDARETDRRSGDGPARRARERVAARARGGDPRKDGVQAPPRRPRVRPAEVDDVAGALARIPDADSANGNGSNGNGRRHIDPLLAGSAVGGSIEDDLPTEEVVIGSALAATAASPSSAARSSTDAEPAVEDLAPVDDTTGAATADIDTADIDTADIDTADIDTADIESDIVENLPTEVVPVVTPTEVVPVVETDVVPVVDDLVEIEPSPRIYDVELDEPGAYVALVPAVPQPSPAPALAADDDDVAAAPVAVRKRRRPRVRRVTRVVRHVDTWTVFKVAVLFNIVLYGTSLVSGVLLWNVAHGTGTIDNVERFMESFGWERFQFDGQAVFDGAWRIGLFLALALTGLAVLAATTFNLITDIVGGIRVTVLEEEVVVAPPDMPVRRSSDLDDRG